MYQQVYDYGNDDGNVNGNGNMNRKNCTPANNKIAIMMIQRRLELNGIHTTTCFKASEF